MTPDEAAKLADDIVAAWPAGPKRYVWMRELQHLEYAATARVVYRKLVASDDRPPSVARFLDHYRLERRVTSAGPPPPQPTTAMSMQNYIDLLRKTALEGDDDARDQLLAMYRHRRPAKDHA